MAQNVVSGPIQDLKVELTLPASKVEAKSIYLLSLSGKTQMLGMDPDVPMSLFEVYFTCKTKDLSLKDFKPAQDVKLTLTQVTQGDSNNNHKKSEVSYTIYREIYSLSSMETVVFTNDDYLYKLVLGHPEAPFANLTAIIETAREGSVKDVLQAVLTDANVTKCKLDGLKSGFLTSSKRWYYQRSSHWQFIVDELLTPNGLTAYLNEDGNLVFIENGKDYKDADFSPWVTTGSPIYDKINNSIPTSINHVVYSALHTLRSTETFMPIQAVNVSAHDAKTKDTLQKGVHPKDDKMFSYLHGNFGDNSNITAAVAQQLFANATWKQKILTGESTTPLFLGKKIQTKKSPDEFAIPAALSIRCSFYNGNLTTQANLPYFTGMAPNTFSFSAVLVPDKVMPQLTYAPKDGSPILLEGVVVDAGGKNTGKPAAKANTLRIGLFAENKQGQDFTIVEMQITENFSLENSTPHPGTKVLVAFLPALGRFYCIGKIRMNSLKNEMWLKTSAEQPLPTTFVISDDQEDITGTNGPNTIKLSKASIILSTKKSNVTLDDDTKIESTNIKLTASADIENKAKDMTTTTSGGITNKAGGSMKNEIGGSIENKASKISNK